MIHLPEAMNDRVKAAIAKLLHAHADGYVVDLRFEFLTPSGEVIGTYTDDYLSRPTDSINGIDLLSQDAIDECKDCFQINEIDHMEVMH